MNPNPVHRLPAPLEAAVQRLKLAAREAVERTVESLGLTALAAGNTHQRDSLLGAQFELNRKSAMFILAFNDGFDERVTREVSPRSGAAPGNASAGWDALSLVEDREVEMQVAAERFALEYGHGCEWELRELDSYVASLLGALRNPLRPETVGHAMMRGIEPVSDRADIRKVLGAEIGRSLGGMLRGTYQDIIGDLRRAGVQAASLSVRTTEPRGATAGHDSVNRPAGMDDDSRSRGAHSTSGAPTGGPTTSGPSAAGGFDSRYGSRRPGGGFGPSTRSGRQGGGQGSALGQVDPAMMALIRRLAYTDFSGGGGGRGGAAGDWDDGGDGNGGGAYSAPMPANLIRAHREELRQAATGSLDHMVIDVIGTLFDQILSDPKVAPQMARQIARLQLPVLRAALGDPSFFSSRRHPVRRFVNRVASLGAAFEDFADEGAQRFLAKVRELVEQVVEGDFEQIELYEDKLAALESFIAEQARSEVDADGDATQLLSAKEDDLRLRALYAQQLQGDLQGLTAPDFVRDFIGKVWSQVLVRAAARDGPDSGRVQRLRHAGRELFMSVQPKASPAHRKAFLADLPKLMQELTEGMELIGWPPESRRAFFGQLLPAHAESLKAPGARLLDYNLLVKRVDGALERSLPSQAAVSVAAATAIQLPVLTDELMAPRFSAEEARRIGLVDESAVDWNGKLDLDLSAEPEVSAVDIEIEGLGPTAAVAEPLEPMQGKSLADHVQIGYAYQMNLEGEWQKARLSHISPGRSFFVFTHGKKHRQAVSLTQRMLVRMCETGRLRAFESAYLLERATARARRQLASLRPG